MKPDVDTLERIKMFCLFALQCYKVSMGSMLSLTVPQECGDEGDMQICSFAENLGRTESLHTSAVTLNFLTLFAFCLNYYLELKRENWFIKHFDINHNFADNYLARVLVNPSHIHLKEKLDNLNSVYWKASLALACIFMVNVVVSTVDISTRFAGGASANAYASFIILITMKLMNSLMISYHSHKNCAAQSAFLTEFTSFNVLDVDEYIPRVSVFPETLNSRKGLGSQTVTADQVEIDVEMV